MDKKGVHWNVIVFGIIALAVLITAIIFFTRTSSGGTDIFYRQIENLKKMDIKDMNWAQKELLVDKPAMASQKIKEAESKNDVESLMSLIKTINEMNKLTMNNGLKPGHVEAYISLSNVLAGKKDKEGAVKAAKDAYKTFKDYEFGWMDKDAKNNFAEKIKQNLLNKIGLLELDKQMVEYAELLGKKELEFKNEIEKKINDAVLNAVKSGQTDMAKLAFKAVASKVSLVLNEYLINCLNSKSVVGEITKIEGADSGYVHITFVVNKTQAEREIVKIPIYYTCTLDNNLKQISVSYSYEQDALQLIGYNNGKEIKICLTPLSNLYKTLTSGFFETKGCDNKFPVALKILKVDSRQITGQIRWGAFENLEQKENE